MMKARVRHGAVADRRPRLSPKERVLRYLETEVERPDLAAGQRLPTNREIAAQVGVSVFTVQSAIQALVQRGLLRTRSGGGTFLAAKPLHSLTGLRIAVSTPLALDGGMTRDGWTGPIVSGIFHGATLTRPPMMLVGMTPQPTGTESMAQRLLGERAQAQGLILFPYSVTPDAVRDEVCLAYERDGKPVVHLNPPRETATANFVSVDYFSASRLLGQVWKDAGRRRILLLVGPSLCESVSARLRLAGLVSAIGTALGRTVSLQVADQVGLSEPAAAANLRQCLVAQPDLPDAVYGTDDHIALAAVRVLEERGVRVPDDVSVVGGTGKDLSDTRCPQLTRLGQPLWDTGKQLVAMLAERIRQNGAAVPGCLLPASFIGGATTRPAENSLLLPTASGLT